MLLRTILKDEMRFLTFRSPSAVIREHRAAYLAFGLLATWAAGIGRYWDSASATVWQHLGLSSVTYALVFAMVLWLLAAPLAPRNWTYRNVLLFVTLTSPPALLYAVPVELWLPDYALAINSGFLAIVAAWRIALLFVFLKHVAALGTSAAFVATLLPIALIVDLVFLMGIGDAVYTTMAGLQDPDGGGRLIRLSIAQLICLSSATMTPVLLTLYAWMAYKARSSPPAHADVPSACNAIMPDIHIAYGGRPKDCL
jgi:hypothetical protein